MFVAATQHQNTLDRDRSALFENLMRSSSKRAYTLAYRLTGNAAEAEDLVQESFVRAYRFFHRYDDSLPFTSWLYRIMTNAHIDQMRRRGRLKTTSMDQAGSDGATSWDLPDPQPTADRQMLDGMVDEHLQDALDTMNSEFRTAVLLADVEGMAYEEIADVMQTSVGTVRSRIHRGRRQLRGFLLKAAPAVYRRIADEL
jgi:RNA polymerase sigma-70 factor (ECF subfamily)